MKIKELAHRDLATIDPECTLLEAARKMRAYDVGSLPVQKSGRLVGIVTDRDLVLRGTAEGRDPRGARVRDVMSMQVLSCSDRIDVKDAMKLMLENRARRVVVVNDDHRPVGLVSLRDLALAPGGESFAGEIYAALSLQTAGRH
ncbi:MAG TPA: CBS domain-containing protein [Candidatus Eisenbacteria bacterium]|jgi:CBS domain-containing protein|nr:CBS domain-containing protein [Candidatus Eisenbacteria bacterium]